MLEVFVFGKIDAVEGLLSEEGFADIGFDEGTHKMPLGREACSVDRDAKLLAEGDNLLDESVGHSESTAKEVQRRVPIQPLSSMSTHLSKSHLHKETL